MLTSFGTIVLKRSVRCNTLIAQLGECSTEDLKVAGSIHGWLCVMKTADASRQAPAAPKRNSKKLKIKKITQTTQEQMN